MIVDRLNANGEKFTRVGVVVRELALPPEEARVIEEHARRMVGRRTGDVLVGRAWKKLLDALADARANARAAGGGA